MSTPAPARSHTPRARTSGAHNARARRDAEPVEVSPEPDGAPAQFLWRGALWLVREAQPDADRAGSGWRVQAGQGPGRARGSFCLWSDVRGRWWLQQVAS